MPGGSEDTIRLIDLPSNKEDIAELIAEIKKLDEAAKGISGISIFGKTGNAAEARQQQQQFAAGLQQIAELQAKMIDLENQLAEARKRGGSNKPKNDEEIRSQVEVAEARRKNIATIKEQIKWNEAEADSMVRKRIELKQIKAEYIKLGPEKQAMESGQAMITQMRALSDELLKQESSYGQFGRNVGNYSEALKVLEEQMSKTVGKMSEMENRSKTTVQNLGAAAPIGFNQNQWKNQNTTAFTGANGQTVSILNEDAEAYAKTSEQAELLNVIIQKQENGFSSVTQKIRTTTRDLISMRQAGLGGTEAFEMLEQETIKGGRSMKEQLRDYKLLESELPALKALTLAAKGLGGAYAIGSGAANLFADGNEKVQEKMQKMMAVMMILQGLEEAWQLVNQAGAAAMAFRMTAMEGATFATELFAAATDEATAAMTALDAVMIASGIGAIVAALGGMIYLLSRATVNTEQLFEAQAKLNESYKDYYDTLIKSNEALGMELEKQDEIGKKAEEIQAINVRSIEDQKNLNAAKRQNAEADKKRAAEVMEEFKKQIDGSEDLQGQYDEQVRRLGRFKELSLQYQADIAKGKQYGESTSEAEEFLKNNEIAIKQQQSLADALKGKLDRYNELIKVGLDADQALKVLNAEDEKFAHELYERKVKALTEIANLIRGQSADLLQLQGNAAGAGDAQLKALDAERMIREKIITSTMEQELRAENLTKDERQLIREKANQQLIDLDTTFIGREAQIRYTAKDQDVNDANETNEALLKQREQFYQRRQQQAENDASNRKSFLETQRDGELKGLLETHTQRNPLGRNNNELVKYNEQKLAIETEYNNKILQSDEELNRKQIAINIAKIRDLQSVTPKTEDQKKQQAKDIDDLHKQNNSLTDKNTNIELQIAQATANKKTQIAKDSAEKQKEIIEGAVKYEQAAQEVVMAAVNAGYEHELIIIERQIKKNNELKESETARIQNSTLAETQKAAAMERLQLETEARNTALQRKANQTKAREAEADRDAAVLKIFGNTLIDASAAGWITPAAIAIEVMGAAQIAALLAKQIPKYEIGTDFHPGGPMMVHPGEMRIDPSGKISMTPDQPALTFGDPGTRIIPKHKTEMMNDILLASIFSGSNQVEDSRLHMEIQDMKTSLMQAIRDQTAAIKKQKPSQTHVHVDANFLTYIKTCL